MTQDIYTGIRVAVEVLLRLSKNRFQTSPPSFPFLSNAVGLDTVYGAPGSAVYTAVEITTDGDPYDLYPLAISSTPSNFEVDIDIIDNQTGMIKCTCHAVVFHPPFFFSFFEFLVGNTRGFQ